MGFAAYVPDLSCIIPAMMTLVSRIVDVKADPSFNSTSMVVINGILRLGFLHFVCQGS